MQSKISRVTVFFNASVILAGLRSPQGGSGKILKWCQQGKIAGIVSEIIIDETKRHLPKINKTATDLDGFIKNSLIEITSAPVAKDINNYLQIVADPGDAHVLSAASNANSQYLVTLDKKHLLVLKDKIKKFQILTPGELIEKLSISKK